MLGAEHFFLVKHRNFRQKHRRRALQRKAQQTKPAQQTNVRMNREEWGSKSSIAIDKSQIFGMG